ncbi:Fis family transcriptional regulator [Methylococcaceae bacterium CS1]|nr:Fis family transcriptional regulator [Methylococcaceae bacterium CS4]TXL02819.1 Fis family transcriptional regulator [Methylococcaceae bacterium CS1]
MSQQNLLRLSVIENVSTFLNATDTDKVKDLYAMVIDEVEQGILEATMEFAKGNQSDVTSILTMSRATLRKKLQKHDLLYHGKYSKKTVLPCPKNDKFDSLACN